MFGKQMWLSHPETRRYREDFDQTVLAGAVISTTPSLYNNVDSYGDSSLAGAGPLSKFF